MVRNYRNWINGWSTNTWEITVLLRSGQMEKIFTFHLPAFFDFKCCTKFYNSIDILIDMRFAGNTLN